MYKQAKLKFFNHILFPSYDRGLVVETWINMLLTNLTPTKDVRLRSNKFGIVVGTLSLCSLDNENLIISLQNQISQFIQKAQRKLV